MSIIEAFYQTEKDIQTTINNLVNEYLSKFDTFREALSLLNDQKRITKSDIGKLIIDETIKKIANLAADGKIDKEKAHE